MATITKEPALTALERKVAARQKFIEALADFITSITCRGGKISGYQEHSCHTSMTAEVDDFKNFSFHYHGSYSMMGGETVSVWYHPDGTKSASTKVLELEWWDIAKCTVKHFDKSFRWQRNIRRMMKTDKETVVAELKQRQAHTEEQSTAQAEEARRRRTANENTRNNAARLQLA